MPETGVITSAELARQTPGRSTAGSGTDWMLLDVRTDSEWDRGHIEGSTHIPLDQLEARTGEVSESVVCICAVGGRSAQAAAYLASTGRQAINLEGGVQGWIAAGNAVVR